MAKKESGSDEEDMDETSIYDEDGREDLVEDDEMSSEEEGFMKGYEDAEDKEEDFDEEGGEEE